MNAIDLNEIEIAPAQMLELSFIVQARFVEAIDTAMHIPEGRIGPAGSKGFWPSYFSENPMPKRKRFIPSSHAISRYEEVFFKWGTRDFNLSPDDSDLLFAHASSLCSRQNFGTFAQYAEKKAIVRRTAERRVTALFQGLANDIRKMQKSLHLPDADRLSLLVPKWGKKQITIGGIVSIRMPDAKPTMEPGVYDVIYA